MLSLSIPLFNKTNCKVELAKVTYIGPNIKDIKDNTKNTCNPYNYKKIQDISIVLFVYNKNKGLKSYIYKG